MPPPPALVHPSYPQDCIVLLLLVTCGGSIKCHTCGDAYSRKSEAVHEEDEATHFCITMITSEDVATHFCITIITSEGHFDAPCPIFSVTGLPRG
jgi:hypothetical protein